MLNLKNTLFDHDVILLAMKRLYQKYVINLRLIREYEKKTLDIHITIG